MPSTTVNEQQIVEALHRVPAERWEEILNFLRSFQGEKEEEPLPAPAVKDLAKSIWSADALQQYPRPVQDAILREQAAQLIEQHQRDPDAEQGVVWWTVQEIVKMPREQRGILLEASAIVAEEEYRTNSELTAFEAFGEDDLYDDYPDDESSSPLLAPPKRGEVWMVNFDPSVGAEIGKIRPAVIVNEDYVGRLPLRIVVPITDWKPVWARYRWFVFLRADRSNGLTKDSGADTFQIKSLSLNRFVRRLGQLTDSQMDAIASAIKINVGAP